MPEQSKTLGVLGGLGPMATVYFYELVTARTLAATDQEHLDMVISSKASTPDRSAFILGRSKADPFTAMLGEARRLQQWGADVIAIPCNTAHYFYERLNSAVSIPVLNMVGGTVERARAMGSCKVGILATEGTVLTGTYQKACDAAGLPWAVPTPEAQAQVTHVIYQNVKAGLPAEMPRFDEAARQLLAAGCDALILGCTELSLVKKEQGLGREYIDSMEVLAELSIAACGKRLRPPMAL